MPTMTVSNKLRTEINREFETNNKAFLNMFPDIYCLSDGDLAKRYLTINEQHQVQGWYFTCTIYSDNSFSWETNETNIIFRDRIWGLWAVYLSDLNVDFTIQGGYPKLSFTYNDGSWRGLLLCEHNGRIALCWLHDRKIETSWNPNVVFVSEDGFVDFIKRFFEQEETL